ncbi:LamG domain-containing protein [Draconibacterium halophilum]|uniref:LamG domain-containing protein n=1 Tax=Draconibacterium halophilum TaxID=2706887 RepID=A0A6C0RBX0_9BACT|nr:LamG domain-containing protein [Draconibacterium halophilum]QIA07255.1 LamG domain-containing protein [Draconibacterium halophilum]
MKKYLLLILFTCFFAFAQAQPFGSSALWFDDLNDYVSANSVSAAMSSQGAMTLEAWIYPESFETQDFVLTFHAAAPDYDNRILLGLKSGVLVAGYKTPSSLDISSYGTNTLPLNQWSHIAWTIAANGSSVVYLNGVIEIDTFTVDVGAWPESEGTFSIGQDYDGENTTDHFHGLIDEVRVWNVVRTQTEIQNNRSDVLSNPTGETNLVAYFTFDDTSSGTLTDESVNSNTGTLHFYDGGDGTPENAYQIASVTDLVYLSQHTGDWNKNFLQTANIDFGSDETVVDWNGDGIVGDAADANGFFPLGSSYPSTSKFTGNYDGQEYSISNLYVNRTGSYNGLFGYNDGATLKRIILLNALVNGGDYTALLVGNDINGIIESCLVSGTINGSNYIGGLVGQANNVSYNRCAANNITINAVSYIGGLIGNVNNTASNITNSYATGIINSGVSYVGGLIGNFWSPSAVTVNKCYASVSSGNKGFIGFASDYNNVSNSYWDVEVDGINGNSSGDTNYGAIGKNTAEMKNASTFTSWDFTEETGDWQIENDYYISYPYLQAFTYDAPGASPEINPIPGLATTPVTWTGATDSDWNTASNWNPAVVPTANVDATIPASGVTNFPVVNSATTAAVKNLTNNSTTNNAITVQAGGKLTVNGVYTAVNGAKIKVTGAQ